MTRQAITSDALPPTVGPFSHAIRAGVGERELLFLSAAAGLDPATGALVPGGTAAQAEQTLRNLAAVLEAAGLGLDDVLKVNVYLVDMADYAAMNAVFAGHFAAPHPARTTVAVAALPLGARVEMEIVAAARVRGDGA